MLNLVTFQGFFWVFLGAEIRPHSQWNLGDFFPNFEKNPNLPKKKKNFFFFFFFLKNEIFLQLTHTIYMVTLSLNLMAIVCVKANLFLLSKNHIIVHYNKFPNKGLPRLFSQSEMP